MAGYDDFILYDGIAEDLDKMKQLTFGSEDWKRVSDSIDKRYNTVVNECKLSNELAEKEERLKLEQMKFERDAEIRELEIEQQDRKSKRELIGKVIGVIAGIGIVAAKLVYDNSDAITDKFTLDAGSKMINSK